MFDDQPVITPPMPPRQAARLLAREMVLSADQAGRTDIETLAHGCLLAGAMLMRLHPDYAGAILRDMPINAAAGLVQAVHIAPSIAPITIPQEPAPCAPATS